MVVTIHKDPQYKIIVHLSEIFLGAMLGCSKQRLWHRCFPVDFANFLRISFLTEQLWWLLLSLIDTQVQSIEDSSLQNISNHIAYRQSQISILYIKIPGFFIGKQYMKTPKRVPTKVQRIIETLSKILVSNANIIFSTMSITFFRGVILKCIFREKNNLCFFDRRLISCLQEEKHHLYRIYRKNHISMYFLRNIIFHFSSRKDITFSRKRNAIFPDDTRKIPVFQCYFLERISFQNI